VKTRVLLIEDDSDHCQEYVAYNEEQGTPYNLYVAYGCLDGFALLESFQPDVILLDLMLNNSDGSGLEFLTKLKELKLLKRPRVIIITSVLSKRMHETVLELDADFLITKDKVDYSPKFAFDLMKSFSVDGQSVRCQYNSEEMIKSTITEMIEKVGITYGVDGRDYIIDSIYLVFKNKAKFLAHDVYPELGRKYEKSPQAIEQAIRTAINKAWKQTDISVLNKYYTPQTSFLTGAPSIKEFIFFFVGKIKA
jgi:CheY-like chemotaxis protein